MTFIRYTWVGLDEMIEEIDRITLRDRSYEVTGPLTRLLLEGYEDTQARVASPMHPHVPTYTPTGSLANSGDHETEFDGGVWTGTIRYGGESAPNDVDYAIFEMARGDIHDFFAGLPTIFDHIPDVIHGFWQRQDG